MPAESAERDRLIRTLTKELREKNLALFIGAGFSMDSGFVSWSQLLAPIAEELKLDIKREEANLVTLAQYYYNAAGSNWAAAGFTDTLLGWMMTPEVADGYEKGIHARVQG